MARMWATKEAKLSDFLVETKHLASEKKKAQPVSNSWDDFVNAVEQLPITKKKAKPQACDSALPGSPSTA